MTNVIETIFFIKNGEVVATEAFNSDDAVEKAIGKVAGFLALDGWKHVRHDLWKKGSNTFTYEFNETVF